jgi:hypothetical protein
MSEELMYWLLSGVAVGVCVVGLWGSIRQLMTETKCKWWHKGWAEGYNAGKEDEKHESKNFKRKIGNVIAESRKPMLNKLVENNKVEKKVKR